MRWSGHLDDLTAGEKRALLVQLLQTQLDKPDSLLDAVTANVAELSQDAVLEPSIGADGALPPRPGEPSHVLLTGATGFLGSFLLQELLQQTAADIYCLVRASDAREGRDKLRSVLDGYGIWDEAQSGRIVPVPGDLSEPHLGLAAREFDRLADTLDVVYHSGAVTNWVFPYNRLKLPNVSGTHEVLRLATCRRLKPVHFVSTLAVFPLVGTGAADVIREDDSLDHGGTLYGGYAQSKWVAEKLVTIGGSRGVPVCVYRPALITGHSGTGAWNTADTTARMIKNWIQLGAAYELDTTVDMVPVDYVSRAIVYLSRQRTSLGQTFHLASPRRVHITELVESIRSFGYVLRQIPYEAWRAQLMEFGRRMQDAMSSVVPLFSLSVSAAVPALMKSIPRFDCRRTLAALAGSSIACPTVDARLLHVYLSMFIRRGFLPLPPSPTTLAISEPLGGRRPC